MLKKYLQNEVNNFNKNMVANFKTLFEPVKVDFSAILDWLWMMVRVIIILFGIVTVIGIVQKPGKDASTVYTLQVNHEEMVQDDLE